MLGVIMFSGPVRKAVESRALGKVGVIIEEDFSVPLCFVYVFRYAHMHWSDFDEVLMRKSWQIS